MEDGPPAAPAHTHRLPLIVRFGILGLTGAVFLLLVAVGLLATYVYQQQQYIQGKGVQRDAENARLEEQIREGMCELLDTFPAGLQGLERARTKYHCGPGIPLDQLTPQEQAQLQGNAAPVVRPETPPSTPAAPPPPVGSAAVPDPPRPTGAPVPPRPSDAPAPVDLGPVRDLLCNTLPTAC